MARRVLHDEFFRRAKAEGYLARSAYKLIELDDRRRLIRRGGAVLDVGCAPGSWLQVAAERAGPKGVVVGIDLQRVDDRDIRGRGAPVHLIEGDFTAVDASAMTGRLSGREPALFDTLLSDMAPKTSGAGDHFLSVRLCEAILDRAAELLRVGGSLAMKVFEGEAFPELLERTRSAFADTKALKPKASRDASRETYVVARGFKAPRPAGGDR